MKKLNQHLSHTAYLLIRLIAVLNGTAEDEFHLWNLYLLFGTARFLIELCRLHLEPPRTLFFLSVRRAGRAAAFGAGAPPLRSPIRYRSVEKIYTLHTISDT